MKFDRWVDLGRRVREREDSSLWWLGDWLNHGTKSYGSCYRQGVELAGLDYQTLRNYAMVARRFEVLRRRDTLSFHHHAEVCALADPEQDRWLDLAEIEHWSRNALRSRLREARLQAASPATVALRLRVDGDCRERWLAAAAACGLTLDAWIIRTLEGAVSNLPDMLG